MGSSANAAAVAAPQVPPFIEGKVTCLSTELTEASPIYFGFGIESAFIDHLNEHVHDKVFLFVDQGLLELHGRAFIAVCHAALGSRLDVTVLPAGESCKTFGMLETTCEQLIAKGASKRSILVSFGGGATGNLVGMAAGLLYRGVRYIEVPTTMTGQTDSILSNKQAINGREGKNHFGIYFAPLFIWSDVKYLMTEPARLKRCGLVEAVKNGLISDVRFLDYLKANLHRDQVYSPEELYKLVYHVILSKLPILRADPSEKKYAIILEYGHTFGHGIEWMARKHGDNVIHGEAVALGMRIAARLSHRLGMISNEDVALHYEMIEDVLGVDVAMPPYVTSEGLIHAMVADNKKTGRDIRFVLLDKPGSCHNPEGDWLTTVDLALVREVLDCFIEEQRLPVAA